MLRSNSKEVKEKINQYIIDSYYDCTDYDDFKEGATLEEIKKAIANDFVDYLGNSPSRIENSIRLEGGVYKSFVRWCSGLVRRPDTTYYLGTAIKLVGDILEETEEERARYSQCEAEELMTHFLFSSLYDDIYVCLYSRGWYFGYKI